MNVVDPSVGCALNALRFYHVLPGRRFQVVWEPHRYSLSSWLMFEWVAVRNLWGCLGDGNPCKLWQLWSIVPLRMPQWTPAKYVEVLKAMENPFKKIPYEWRFYSVFMGTSSVNGGFSLPSVWSDMMIPDRFGSCWRLPDMNQVMDRWRTNYPIWLVVTGCHQFFIFPYIGNILGISSSQLTNSYFSEGFKVF